MISVLRNFSVSLLILVAPYVEARTQCHQTFDGTLCTSQVDFTEFHQSAFESQEQSQWCWAASISMLFNYYGYNVSQSRIVTEAYGSAINMPAFGITMARSLNRLWVDDNRTPFIANVTGLYDPTVGIATLDSNQLIRELDQDRPFVIGTAGHAVVVTAMQYFSTPFGPSVVAVGVFDPWPGRGPRTLSVPEATPAHLGGALAFVATVNVQPGQGNSAVNPMGRGGGAVDFGLLLGCLCAAALLLCRRHKLPVARASMGGPE